jgi:hypothetical protein
MASPASNFSREKERKAHLAEMNIRRNAAIEHERKAALAL